MMNLPSMRRPPRAAAVLCLAMALGVGQAARACGAPIRLGTGALEPYGYYDAHQRYVGMDADMVRAIFTEAGCVLVELPLMPASRNLLLFEQGKIDLMAGASITSERRKRAHFSVSYRDETVGLFALADGFEQYAALASFADFLAQPFSMLGPRAGWYGAEYERQVPMLKARGRLSLFGDVEQGVRMLAAKRARFVLGDAAGVERAAARQGVKVRALPFWLVKAPVHLMLSRATVSEADVRQLDAAIARLQQRGEMEAIRRPYGGW
jgi:polar amino acid transport system substrate-binding protein